MATETLSRAAQDVVAERQRQREAEGWTVEHDDYHIDESLAVAAACYALKPSFRNTKIFDVPLSTHLWPWERHWWKPTPADRRKELVKAGALIIAEIERLDRKKAPDAR